MTSDQLGRPRIITDGTGNVLSRRDFMPFGEEAFIGIGLRAVGHGYTYGESTRQKITGYERDQETDLDFAVARYYKPSYGRFTSPDDFRNDTNGKDPQSWNLYIYVRNSPQLLVDPTGKMADFYEEGTGRWVGSDGERDDKVYVVTVRKEVVESKGDKYFWFSSSTPLSIGHKEFQARAATAYGESSAYRSEITSDLASEMMAIAYVNQRNNVAYGANNAQAQIYKNTSMRGRNGTKMRLANFAVLNSVTGGFDPSFGATMWDGAEQSLFFAKEKRTSVPATTGKWTWELHQNTMGWDISNNHYATWKTSVGNGFKAPQTTQAVPGTRNAGKTRLHSTAVYGRTIFWRVTP